MLSNYFKIAWRNLVRNKVFSAINILGLALGIACSLLILLWVRDEKRVDAFHSNGKQLYHVYERSFYDGKVDAGYSTQGLLASELKRLIPEVQYSCAVEFIAPDGIENNFQAGEKVNKMAGMFAGEDFFKMFSYPLLRGTASGALNTPSSIAVSRKMAELFFGSAANAIGKTIRFENKEELKVTAVFENLPSNSSLQFNFLRNWTDFIKQNNWVNNWGNTDPLTFVQLKPRSNPVNVEAKLKDFIYRYQQRDKSFYTQLALQPYGDKYLHSNFTNGYVDGGRIAYVRLFSLVAFFILLIACINFMNLATARSAKRAKEVGVRKVIGARRMSLIAQFAGEALLLTFISLIIAIAFAEALLPVFNKLSGKQLALPFSQPFFWVALLALLAATAIVAGSYPALFLSSLKPVRVLKGSLKFSLNAALFRKGLVVFQFVLSLLLIVGMIVIYRQVNYIQTKNIGYNRENLLYLPIEGDLIKNYSVFKQEAAMEQSILNISKMRNSPTNIGHHTTSIYWEGKDPGLTVSFADAVVGYDFVKTMKLNLAQGRDFSPEFATDSSCFMLNETAVKKIGYKNPLGKLITWGKRPGKIIGILKDFHFSSLHQSIDPLIVRMDDNWGWGTILIRTKAGKTSRAIAALQKICRRLNPAVPFTYQFSDQEYAKLYNNEQVVSRLSAYFAFLAIFISCLGLFGLAMYTAEQRNKEIGVRKVLGAGAGNIIKLLSANFLKPVAIAMLIAFPVAWYVMHQWLQGYAYQVAIQWWMFGLAAVLTICIALLTVSYQTIRSALSNPVNSLRSE